MKALIRLGSICALLLALGCAAAAQEKEQYFSLPFKGHSSTVDRLLRLQNDRAGRNVIFLISPMTCPRCEGLAYELMRQVRQKEFQGAVLCVVSYPRLRGAMEYLKKRNYPVKTILDTAGTLFSELNLGQTPPYVTVWDSTGALLYSQVLYGVNSDDSKMWAGVFGENAPAAAAPGPGKPAARSATTVGVDEPLKTWATPSAAYRTTLVEVGDSKLGNVGLPSVNLSRRMIALTDHLSLTVALFDLDSGRKILDIAPDLEVRRTYSQVIERKEFERLEEKGIAHSMFFGSFFLDDSTLVVSSTLPEFKNVEGGGLAYYNAAVFIGYAIPSGNIRFMTRVATLPTAALTVTHASMPPAFDPRRRELALLVGKGYPYTGTSSATAVGSKNPVNPEFYENVPLFKRMRLDDGELIGEIGRLDSTSRRLGVGYALAIPRIAFSGDDYYIAQNPVPYIVRSSGKNIQLRSYFTQSVARPKRSTTELPPIEDIHYLADSAGARIVMLSADKKRLLVGWHVRKKGVEVGKGHYPVVQEYSLPAGRLVKEWVIPENGADGKLADMTLDADGRIAHCVYQTATSTVVIGYRLE